jgi:arginase
MVTKLEIREPAPAKSRAPVSIIGVACGAGAPDPRCADGPAALRKYGLVGRLRHVGMDATWSGTIPAPAGEETLAVVSAVAEALATRTEALVARGRLPVVLGGDHSCAIGTWKGIARALGGQRALGLVWIDAHMDAHTAQTSMSGKVHGMPLACLLGEGDPRLTGIAGGARLDPSRICLVGVRSFESGEAALLQRLGVRVFFMHDVERRGLQDVMKEAMAIAASGGRSYGISLDLDAVDPTDAPGVGSPAPGGIRAAELLRALANTAGARRSRASKSPNTTPSAIAIRRPPASSPPRSRHCWRRARCPPYRQARRRIPRKTTAVRKASGAGAQLRT